MSDPQATPLLESIVAELRRIGLDPDELTGLVIAAGDADVLLAHLRGLSPDASWAAAFPRAAEDSWPNAPTRDRPLGPFDYAEPPRGPAVFASFVAGAPPDMAANLLARVRTLGIPIFGSGAVLDRGAPHLFVVLEHGVAKDSVEAVTEFLRAQPEIANSYPVRWGAIP